MMASSPPESPVPAEEDLARSFSDTDRPSSRDTAGLQEAFQSKDDAGNGFLRKGKGKVNSGYHYGHKMLPPEILETYAFQAPHVQ